MHPSGLGDVYAVLAAPFTSDSILDHTSLERQVDRLIRAGVSILTVNGNTGEFFSLSVSEAKEILSTVVATAGSRAKVIAGVGHDLRTAQDLTEHAADLGCEAVMVHNPVGPFATPGGLERYLRAITAASSIGVIPYIRSRNLSTETLLDLAADERVVAMKYAVNDLAQVGELASSSHAVWVCGTAELWAPAFMTAGFKTFTSGLANVAPKLALEFHRALLSGNTPRVRQLWTALHPFETLRARADSGMNVSVVKEAMGQLGLCEPIVRAPSSQLGESERLEVSRILQRWQEIGMVEGPGDE